MGQILDTLSYMRTLLLGYYEVLIREHYENKSNSLCLQESVETTETMNFESDYCCTEVGGSCRKCIQEDIVSLSCCLWVH